MKGDPKHILDKPFSVFRDDSIDLDLKMVRGFALSYFIYGLVYWIQIKEFLVPLPMVYFFVPLAGVVMFVRSVKWIGSFLFLLIPFIVLKDLVWIYIPGLTIILSVLTFLSWTLWTWLTFIKNKNTDVKSVVFLVSQHLIWLLWLIQIEWVQVICIVFVLVGVTLFVRMNLDEKKQVFNLRLGLLIQLIISLYLMQKVSILWVALS